MSAIIDREGAAAILLFSSLGTVGFMQAMSLDRRLLRLWMRQ